MYLDADIVEYFKDKAAAPGSAGYQTLINATLRQVVETGDLESADTVKKTLLADEDFVGQLARNVSSLLTKRSY